MLQTTPPPISVSQLAVTLSRLPDLPTGSFWALWDEYFESRPRRRNRNWLISCLARKIQDVAWAEYAMELRVARKLARATCTRRQRRMRRRDCVGETFPDAIKRGTTAGPIFGINALIGTYLRLCPDLTYSEAVWLVCRTSPSLSLDGHGHALPASAVSLRSSPRPPVPTPADRSECRRDPGRW
jgi:hypothetical protein